MSNTNTNYLPKLLAMGQLALRENAIMPRLINTNLGEVYAQQKGDVINVPIPSAVATRDVTPAVTYAANVDFSPTVGVVTLDQWKESNFQLSDKDRTQIQESDVIPMQASEAIKSLANAIDQFIIGRHIRFFGKVGTQGTTPFSGSLNMASAARKTLNKQLAPVTDRRAVIDPDAEDNLLLNSQILQTDQRGDSQGIIEGQVLRKLGFDFFMDQNITGQAYTPGTAWSNPASWTFDGSNQAGVSTANVVYTGSGTVNIGDIFALTSGGLGYVITAVATMVTATTNAISFYPPLRVTVATAATLVVGGTTAYVPNLAFHRDAFVWASRPLATDAEVGRVWQAPVDPVTGIALRLEVSRQYKQTTYSFDALYGCNVIRREYGCKIAG